MRCIKKILFPSGVSDSGMPLNPFAKRFGGFLFGNGGNHFVTISHDSLKKYIMPTNGSVFREADNAVKPPVGINLLKIKNHTPKIF